MATQVCLYSNPNPTGCSSESQEEGTTTRVAAVGESGAQKQGKGESTKLGQAGRPLG